MAHSFLTTNAMQIPNTPGSGVSRETGTWINGGGKREKIRCCIEKRRSLTRGMGQDGGGGTSRECDCWTGRERRRRRRRRRRKKKRRKKKRKRKSGARRIVLNYHPLHIPDFS